MLRPIPPLPPPRLRFQCRRAVDSRDVGRVRSAVRDGGGRQRPAARGAREQERRRLMNAHRRWGG
eukprot:scaffold8972_cov118-Isochrysis_galbana.AAC.20